jgi:hypothetical protein
MQVFKIIVQNDFQKFIQENEYADEKNLLLKHKTFLGVPATIVANQIVGRRKSKTKLPTFYQTPGIVFPAATNLEQCSSEKAAEYKTTLLKSALPENTSSLLDLTGGFGVDSFFLSKIFSRVDYVEPAHELLEIAKHNHTQLLALNINHHATTAEDFLQAASKFDVIYVDPSRRKSSQKIFKLAECEPNVVALNEKLFDHTDHLLIKASPLLDIQQGLRELRFVKTVFVVAVENEVKELLFFCVNGFSAEPEIRAINLSDSETTFSFLLSEEKKAETAYAEPLAFVYEPNASLLKAGAFKKIALDWGVFKIDRNTHLYTSNTFIKEFPGRTFQLMQPFEPRLSQQLFPDGKVNVISRNYPLTPDALKKKYKLNDGGELFLLAFSSPGQKHLWCAKKVSG